MSVSASPEDTWLLAAKVAEVAATADQYPGVVIVLKDQAQSVAYMSERGLRQLGTTLADLQALGPLYHERYFNLEEADTYVPKIMELLERNNLHYVVSFFQQVRTGPAAAFEWHLSTAKVLAQDSAGQPLLVICFSAPIEPESHITTKVQRLLDETIFLRRNAGTFARLTLREREVLRYLALGYSSGEIADKLHLSVQTAETHRRNLRQKLNAASAFELGQYARTFDLI